MGLFDAVAAGLSSAGYSAGDLLARGALMDQESDRQQRLTGLRARLQEEAEVRADQRKRAPLQRLQSMAQEEAGREVPVEPSPVSSLTGSGLITTDGAPPQSAGFKGDPQQILRGIMAMRDGEDKQNALAQFRAQYGADAAANRAAVAGQTRRRTSEEAFDAALERARTNDLEAYAMGKPLAAEKTVTVPDGGTVIDRNGKVIFSAAGVKEAREAEREDRRDAREAFRQDAADRRQLERLAAMEAMNEARQNGKAPSGYRAKPDGTLEFIPGGPADPENKNKPLPASTASGLLTNQDNLRRAQRALALVSGQQVDGLKGDKEATGVKGMLPNTVLNYVDPAGVDTRAAIADIGSMVIHDRSGAAVTAAEFPRLRPFVPSATDDNATARKKLNLFVKNYQALVDDQVSFYKESGYKVPAEVLRDGNGTEPAGSATPTSEAEYRALPPGAEYTAPDGSTRRKR